MATPVRRQTSEPSTGLSEPGVRIEFGREVCCDLASGECREWLVTNGIGGFASGTVAGSASRRYHGLLLAALEPPAGRTQLVASLDEEVRYADQVFSLATHRWASGAVAPQGFLNAESFRLEGTTPVWTFALDDALLEKRVWMRQGENTTYVQYTLVRATAPAEMHLKALVNYRDYHASTHAQSWRMKIEPVDKGVRILAFDGAVPFYLKSADATCEPRNEWYRDCYFPAERDRGLDDREDHLFAASFYSTLQLGRPVTFVLSTAAETPLDGYRAQLEAKQHEAAILAAWRATGHRASVAPAPWLSQLILAADQFVVRRSLPSQPDGRSIIAGYHWFADWGRDTMISLPGLALTTGRYEIAKKILTAFAEYVDQGMLPNNFPDAGGRPGYNTVDAALWYFEAVRQYAAATGDSGTVRALFPVLGKMVEAHAAGTRFHIHVDPADGLLFSGEPGVQLTWMDAKIGDWVVTPRTGKAVEINVLWINALETIMQFAKSQGLPISPYDQLSAKAKAGFERFWNSERGCCFDVIDVPGQGNDGSLRPNQIFAVSLPVSPLKPAQQKAVVDVCARKLLTSYGLRSLAPGEPGYKGHYGGNPRDRDAVYHQGTTWGWLAGPFALAHHRVYGDTQAALRFLEPLGKQVYSGGLGTLSEIFDGDPPFRANGCIAQAWTVGEILRAWHLLQDGRNA